MPSFPRTYTIVWAEQKDLLSKAVDITLAAGSKLDLRINTTPTEAWSFNSPATGATVLSAGARVATSHELEVHGHGQSSSGNGFRIIVGITHDPHAILSNHVVEWVAEDQG